MASEGFDVTKSLPDQVINLAFENIQKSPFYPAELIDELKKLKLTGGLSDSAQVVQAIKSAEGTSNEAA